MQELPPTGAFLPKWGLDMPAEDPFLPWAPEWGTGMTTVSQAQRRNQRRLIRVRVVDCGERVFPADTQRR